MSARWPRSRADKRAEQARGRLHHVRLLTHCICVVEPKGHSAVALARAASEKLTGQPDAFFGGPEQSRAARHPPTQLDTHRPPFSVVSFRLPSADHSYPRQDAGTGDCYEYVLTIQRSPDRQLTAKQTRRPPAGSGNSDAKPSCQTSQLRRRSRTSFDHVWAPRPCSRCCSTPWAASSSPTTAMLFSEKSRSHTPPRRA